MLATAQPEPEVIAGALARDSASIAPEMMARHLDRWWWRPDQRAAFAQWLRDVANALEALTNDGGACCHG